MDAFPRRASRAATFLGSTPVCRRLFDAYATTHGRVLTRAAAVRLFRDTDVVPQLASADDVAQEEGGGWTRDEFLIEIQSALDIIICR